MRMTVGPLPPAVYWRRRALVLGAVLAVLLVLVYSCSSGSNDGDGRAAPNGGSKAPASGTPTPSGSLLTPSIGDPGTTPSSPDAAGAGGNVGANSGSGTGV